MTPEGALPSTKPRRDHTLIKALVRAHRWQRRIESGQAKSITDLGPLSSDLCGPVEGAEGRDVAGFIERGVPGGAAGVEDGVVGRPEAV